MIKMFLNYSSRLFILIVLSGAMFACNSSQKENKKIPVENKTVAVETPQSNIAPTNRKYNDIARFIAGQQPIPGSTIDTSLYHNQWQQYALEQNKKWGKLNDDHFAKMHAFEQAELKQINETKPVIFYPFSGPDFLNASTFFPDAKTYYLFALEPAGSLPDVNSLNKDSVPGYLNAVDDAMYAIINFSFFRTISMASDFNKQTLNGAAHLLSIFLVRTGHTILNMESVAIDTAGNLTAASQSTSVCYANAIKFSIANSKNEIQEVYYFSCDISDLGLNKNKCLNAFLKKLPEVTTYLKSASYLMHKPYFSAIRNTILQKSKFVLQDDSGIPVRFFNAEQWQHQYYGSYDKPINLFANFYQASLKMQYDSTEKTLVKPLGFGIGYDYKMNESNLLLFSKK
jgi:hypothetical protein